MGNNIELVLTWKGSTVRRISRSAVSSKYGHPVHVARGVNEVVVFWRDAGRGSTLCSVAADAAGLYRDLCTFHDVKENEEKALSFARARSRNQVFAGFGAIPDSGALLKPGLKFSEPTVFPLPILLLPSRRFLFLHFPFCMRSGLCRSSSSAMFCSKCHRTSFFDVGNLPSGWRSFISSSVGDSYRFHF